MFLESTLFLQKLKEFKNSVALFWRFSRESSKSHATAASSRVDFGDLFTSERSSRGGYIDFCGSARDSLVGRPSSHEKHLEIFSQFWLWVFWWLALATCFNREKRVFCVSKTVFKNFLIFPSTFCDCSLSSLFLSQLKLTQTLCVTLYKLHFCIFSPPNLQEKGMGSHFLTSYRVLNFIFVNICVIVLSFFVMGLFWFLRLSLFGLLRYCSYANLFQLIDSCIIMCWFP